MSTTLTSGSVLLTTTSMTDLYQARNTTGSAGAQCFNLVASNYQGSLTAGCTVVRTDSSNTILSYLNGYTTSVPGGMALVIADYMILQPGQKIRGQATTSSVLSLDVSVREETYS